MNLLGFPKIRGCNSILQTYLWIEDSKKAEDIIENRLSTGLKKILYKLEYSLVVKWKRLITNLFSGDKG